MRPVSKQRNVLQYPLDRGLSTEAQVRLLRVLLVEVEGAVGVAEASRLAELTPRWARQALERLTDTGLVRRQGSGRSVHYCVNGEHSLCAPLRALFASERERFDMFVSTLRRLAADIPEIREAWVQSLPTKPGEMVEVVLVVEAAAAGWIDREARARVRALEKQHDVIIEFVVRIRADKVKPPAEAVMLYTLGNGPRHRNAVLPPTHQEKERRSLRQAQAMASLVRSDPSLIPRAKHHLDRLLREGTGTADADLAEWRQVLDTHSVGRICDLLVSQSSRGERLRQSMPFLAVLSAEQRDALLRVLEDDG
ncbi:MAG: hypothetical protein GF331_05015 [Chitinivibrionales bacterium]|nr:hypothetical protein [Chitinivibrionales bacterium]